MYVKRVLLLGVCGVLLGLAGAAASPPDLSAQVARGSELYFRRCSVCHGKTGLGLEEARLAFPESHRRCTKCHKSGTSPLLRVPFTDNQMFDIGIAPALRGIGSLLPFRNARELQAFIHQAMPRHAPGTLSAAEAWDITAFVLELRGIPLPADVALGEENAAAVLLHR